jgi:poly-beta-1,6-N-acetyl-D-glucosamine synthase
MSNYILITAVKNEEKFIGETCISVLEQSVRPIQWIIVDDNSNDNTVRILEEFIQTHNFVKIYGLKRGGTRNFSSQVYAQMYGYQKIECNDYEYVGFLDGDIKLPYNYYEKILYNMSLNPKLGIAGAQVVDAYSKNNKRIRMGSENYHVAGGVQFFRRKCFEQIGGYQPIPFGGQDTVADINAMRIGWKVRTFNDFKAEHLKNPYSAKENLFNKNYIFARHAYNLGYSKIYYFFYCIRRIFDRPAIVSFILRIIIFSILEIDRPRRPQSKEFVLYIRKLQKSKIHSLLKNKVGVLF